MDGGEDKNIPSTKIEDGCFLSPLKVFFCRLCSFESLVFEGLLSVVMFICWTYGLPIQKSLTQYCNSTIDYLHATEYTRIIWCITSASMLLTMKRAWNDPIYWMLRWLYCNTVMGIRYVMSKEYNKVYHKKLWHGRSILYPLQPPAKPFVYWGIIMYMIILCITTPALKTSHKKVELKPLVDPRVL